MAKIKVQPDELDVEALEEAEYAESEFDTYDGEVPPKGTILNAYIKTMWWTHTQSGDGMLKVLVIADENEGKNKEYNGLPLWENLALSPGAKFKWKPFIDHFGITLRDIKAKMVAASDEDHPIFGAELSKIGTFEPGSEDSWCRVVTSRERYDDAWQAHVLKWLDFEVEDAEDVEDVEDIEDVEEEPEEDAEDVEDVEDVEEEPAPARSRRASARPAARGTAKPAARRAGAAAKPAAPAARGGRTAAARTARPATAPGRGRRGAAKPAEEDEPPF